ncbi:hypothetical protein [Streptomyces sp. NPDC026589]|uniref:hypothetical protein n=1 Tax=Streptomyces sp. NPDC026589 TaxID=3155609 RepID=UPI0033C91E14
MRHRVSSLLFVAVCSLAPAVLGSLLHWSALLWGFLSAVTASGSLLLVMTAPLGDRAPAERYEPGEPEPPTVPMEQPYQETQVVDAALPSAADGYDFLFSATVWWRPVPDHVVLSDGASPAIAESSVVSRALEVVRHEEPGRASYARYLLEGELCVPLQDRSGRVQAMAADVTLALSPADHERLRKLSDLRKDGEVWEYEREHERSKRRYIGDDVLKSAGSAVVWWLARHENEIEKAVEMIGPLAQISAAANDAEVPELFRHLLVPPVDARSGATVGGPLWDGDGQGGGMFDREGEVGVPDRLLLLLEAMGLKPDTDEYTVLVHRVILSLEMTGLHEAAEDIRRTVLPTPDEAGAEWPDEEYSTGEATTGGPRPQGPPAPDDSSFADADGEPATESGTGRATPEAAESGAGEQNHSWWRTSKDGMAPPHYWDSSHRPTSPRAQDEDENGT